MPPIEAWEGFAGAGAIIIFLGGVAFALQRLGVIGTKKQAGASTPSGPSPEAVALIDATRQLVATTEAIAARSEALGRLHARIDDVNHEVGGLRSEVGHVKGELAAINRNLHLIQEYLLAQK